MAEETKQNENMESGEDAKFRGKFIETKGSRKTAIARVRLYKKGTGVIIVNGKKIGEYFQPDHAAVAKQPLKLTDLGNDLNISIITRGGGKKNQAEASRHGIARALVSMDEATRPLFKAKDWMTRDSRIKERKKPGLKKARRAPQWSKR